MPVRVYTTVVDSGQRQTVIEDVYLVAREGARQYDPLPPGKFGGAWAGFRHGAGLMVPPVASSESLGARVRAGTNTTTSSAGGGPRERAVVPFQVPPRDAKRVTADVTYVPPAGPETVVNHGAAKIPSALAPDSVVNVQTRLTPAGAALARRLGATRLAAALKSSGYILFTSGGGLAHGGDTAPEMIEVPMSNCFRNVQEVPRHPCTQTCPHFPGVEATGYMVYTALGDVFGSTTCRRGAPLVRWPMY